MAFNRPTIYMDHSATTPVRSEVLEAMHPFFGEYYGNPSSIHGIGRKAHAGLDQARRTVARLLGAKTGEIVFTGSGSESDNAGLRGIAIARHRQTGSNRIITTPVEHKAVLETAYDLRDTFGFELTLVPVDEDGIVNPDDVDELLSRHGAENVALISIMTANNEIGSIQPIAEIGEICRRHQAPLHTDAVQAAGKLPLRVDELAVDALSISGHKIYGPKGAGLLYLRQGTPYHSFLTGGSHENNRRAGTENVPGIVGLATALELAEEEREHETDRLQNLRDRLIDGVLSEIRDVRLTGHRQQRLPHHASFVIESVEAEGVLIGLDLAGVAASSGSACTSASQRPSHVLDAIGVPAEDAVGALRLSLGHSNTPEQIDHVLEQLPQIIEQIRGTVPVAI